MTSTQARKTHARPTPVPGRLELFALFADAGRVQALALCAEEELSVGELAELLDDSQPQVSRKVSALRDAGLLEGRRDGTRLYLRTVPAAVDGDRLVADAVAEGRRLCLGDGSLARIPKVLAAREDAGRRHFDATMAQPAAVPNSPEHLAHLAALAPLISGRELAVDIGTGDGLSLDVLAPLYRRVIAVDRSQAQLARLAGRVAERGFPHVSLFPGSFDDAALLERVTRAGGADLVFCARALHHAARPGDAVKALARLLRAGGRLVVLDYLAHSDDSLRERCGDTWLGFEAEAVSGFLRDAGLSQVEDLPVPLLFHPRGPDDGLAWHAWAGRRGGGP